MVVLFVLLILHKYANKKNKEDVCGLKTGRFKAIYCFIYRRKAAVRKIVGQVIDLSKFPADFVGYDLLLTAASILIFLYLYNIESHII